MDIIDIILAKKLTPQGQIETYAQKSQQAVANANQAVAAVEAAAEDIEEKQAAASDLLEQAQEALQTAQEAQIAMPEVYTTTGQNTDGYMTQKAVTDALDTKVNTTVLNNYATTVYVNEKIASIPSSGASGGISNLGPENSGKLVMVDTDGTITPSLISEEDLIESLVISGGYTARNAVGLEIDYYNKSYARAQEATNNTNFNEYKMYGGRIRCNVSDNGNITAFYGDPNYKDDGSNGQVMVYQPRFYYQRIPVRTSVNTIGKVIEKDSIIISYTEQNGFKLHPAFKTSTGEELEYILLSAYEGSLFDVSENKYLDRTPTNVDFNNDKLSSVGGTKPITGTSALTLQRAEQLARNRGSGWHITTLAAENINQMLGLVEFGTMNGQQALGKGISNLASAGGDYNQASLTGSTASLGNNSGRAQRTTNEVNGTLREYTDEDKTAISYRGVENPWGNVWTMIGDTIIYGNGANGGGIPYICSDYSYAYTSIANNYKPSNFSLPNANGWISAFGYGDRQYDWILMPSEVSSNANSALPIGDNGWFDNNLTGIRMVVVGGSWSFGDNDGPFYYGCDKAPTDSTYKSYGARLVYIPEKNTIYTNNITKWKSKTGG